MLAFLVLFAALNCSRDLRSHAARFLFGSFLHAFNAFASFCARVSGFDFDFTAGLDTAGGKFPTPLNVALDGVAKIGGAGGTP